MKNMSLLQKNFAGEVQIGVTVVRFVAFGTMKCYDVNMVKYGWTSKDVRELYHEMYREYLEKEATYCE